MNVYISIEGLLIMVTNEYYCYYTYFLIINLLLVGIQLSNINDCNFPIHLKCNIVRPDTAHFTCSPRSLVVPAVTADGVTVAGGAAVQVTGRGDTTRSAKGHLSTSTRCQRTTLS